MRQQESGLRLDRRSDLEAGGDSGLPILTRSAADSHLLERVTADDEAVRMPPGGPWLTTEDVSVLSAWLDAGAVWDADTTTVDAHLEPGLIRKVTDWVDGATRHARWVFFVGVLFAFAVLLLERRRKRSGASESRFSPRGIHYLCGLLGLAAVGFWQHHRGADAERLETIRELQSELNAIRDPAASSDEFGPVPRRPRHPARMGGEYYRGNDERDDRLYNGGFYRTATFRLTALDATGAALEVGAPVPDGPLFLEVQMDRARGTTAAHFRKHAMGTVFLSSQSAASGVTDTPVPFEVVDPGWSWRARYDLREFAADPAVLRGRVFLYCSASVTNRRLVGRAHYGIDYTINVVDGRVAAGSEVWMGSLFQTENVAQPGPGRIPVAEWFDFRAMPEVEGENTDDPELLGIDRPDGQANRR